MSGGQTFGFVLVDFTFDQPEMPANACPEGLNLDERDLHAQQLATSDPQAAAALDNPKLTAADKTALLLSIGGERLDATGRSFVRVLVEADRVAVLPEIRTLFETLKNDTDGVAKARIESAFPLSDAELAELTAALEKRFGRKIEATTVSRAVTAESRLLL